MRIRVRRHRVLRMMLDIVVRRRRRVGMAIGLRGGMLVHRHVADSALSEMKLNKAC